MAKANPYDFGSLLRLDVNENLKEDTRNRKNPWDFLQKQTREEQNTEKNTKNSYKIKN